MTLRFVQSKLGADPIIVEGYFDAAQSRVFRAWTDPKIIVKWFGSKPNSLHSATVDLRIGGSWRFLESVEDGESIGFEGEYLEIISGERLVFTWCKFTTRATGKRDVTSFSQVEVTFTAKGDGTLVRVIHSAIQSDDTRRHFSCGWNNAFETMSRLFD